MLKLENMQPGEKLEMVIRRHRIIYIILFLYFLVWVAITVWVLVISWFVLHSTLIMLIFWMFFSIFLYIEWLNHELDLFIVTNNRIVWTDQISFLNRNVAECNLWEVQQVNSHTKWLLANVLNYGDVIVQTAWANWNMLMWFAPDSMQNARKVLNIADNYKDARYNRSK